MNHPLSSQWVTHRSRNSEFTPVTSSTGFSWYVAMFTTHLHKSMWLNCTLSHAQPFRTYCTSSLQLGPSLKHWSHSSSTLTPTQVARAFSHNKLNLISFNCTSSFAYPHWLTCNLVPSMRLLLSQCYPLHRPLDDKGIVNMFQGYFIPNSLYQQANRDLFTKTTRVYHGSTC